MDRPTCEGTTKAGRPCRSFALEAGRCVMHDPSRAERMREARADGARKAGALRSLEGRRKRLDTPKAVVGFLSNLVHDVAEGERDVEVAKVLFYGLNVQLRAVEVAQRAEAEKLVGEVRKLLDEARRRGA